MLQIQNSKEPVGLLLAFSEMVALKPQKVGVDVQRRVTQNGRKDVPEDNICEDKAVVYANWYITCPIYSSCCAGPCFIYIRLHLLKIIHFRLPYSWAISRMTLADNGCRND
jgi:hypothetical protein